MIHFSSKCNRDFIKLDAAYRLLAKQFNDLVTKTSEEQQMTVALRKSYEAEQHLRECAEEKRAKDHAEIHRLTLVESALKNELKLSRLEVSELFEECEMLKSKVEALEAIQLSESQFENKPFKKKKKSDDIELHG